jgi:hypothetical protein
VPHNGCFEQQSLVYAWILLQAQHTDMRLTVATAASCSLVTSVKAVLVAFERSWLLLRNVTPPQNLKPTMTYLMVDRPQHGQQEREHLQWQPPLGGENPAALHSARHINVRAVAYAQFI